MKKDQINLPSVSMYHFCTITTSSHMYKTLALYDSIRSVQPDSQLHVLCIDAPVKLPVPDTNIILYTTQELLSIPYGSRIINRYRSSKDKLRWSLKPVFIRLLLENLKDKVIYTDNDIYFFDDYSFLFELLDEHNILLTPHNYPRDPNKDQNWLEANFKVGLYNAGFVGVSPHAADSLEWWAACCAYRCEKNPIRGLFDDQKYLDLLPIIDELTHIVRHKGCNVAEWNKSVIERSIINGKVVLDGRFPLVFVHFNGTTIRAICNGSDPCLKYCYESYFKNLMRYKAGIKDKCLMDQPKTLDKLKYLIWKLAARSGL